MLYEGLASKLSWFWRKKRILSVFLSHMGKVAISFNGVEPFEQIVNILLTGCVEV